MQAGSRLVGQFADDSSVEERLNFDSARQIQFLGLGFRRLVPFLKNFGKGRSVDFDKLLELAEIGGKLLKALFQRGEFGRSSRKSLSALENLLLV